MTPPSRSSVCLALLLAAGCAKARNYADPGGPILTGSNGAAPAGGDRDGEVRVVTFNVKFAKHVDRAVALLRRPGPLSGADVLVLQEMDGPGTEAVARALGMNHAYVPSAVHPAEERDFGVAVLSPWPLEDPSKVPLPHEHRILKTRRAAVAVTVRLPAGPIRVYGLHLESPVGLGGSDRRDQARAVAADAAPWSGPVVVAGDFNGRGGAEELAKAGFVWLTRHVKNTALVFDMDHVLARGLCPSGERAAGAEDDATGASDHDPVWAMLRPCGGAPESGSARGEVGGGGAEPGAYGVRLSKASRRSSGWRRALCSRCHSTTRVRPPGSSE